MIIFTKVKKIYFNPPESPKNHFLNFLKIRNSEILRTLYPAYFVYFWSKIKSESIKLIVMMSTFQITLTDFDETYQSFANA